MEHQKKKCITFVGSFELFGGFIRIWGGIFSTFFFSQRACCFWNGMNCGMRGVCNVISVGLRWEGDELRERIFFLCSPHFFYVQEKKETIFFEAP